MTQEEELQALREENRTLKALVAELLPLKEQLAQANARIKELEDRLAKDSRLQHGDETGIRVYGMLHWLHVNCTRFLTHLAWHASRGREAIDEIGIWPRFAGRGMHDRLVSYDAYACAHSICGAHLVRDCAAVAQQEHQEWAVQMQDFLLDLHDACHEWRLLHLSAVPAIERDEWVAHYFEILAAGYAAQPPPSASSAGSRQGRRKQSKAKNLLDALLGRAEQVLALLDDLRIPFTNNQARPSGTCAGQKFSKRFLAPFAVRLGSPLFAASAVIFRRCRSKDIPCCLL
jgi:Transposase IS66 family